MIDRAGLADYLRRRRELLRPADVGLAPGVRRRTPGLRREEVAQLAGLSVDYYSRLEQGRGPHPSEAVVGSLARALRCDLDERDHVFHLAGFTPPARRAGAHVSPGLLSLVDRLTDVPARVHTDLHDVLCQNSLADTLFGTSRVNPVRAWFTDPAMRALAAEEDRAALSAAHVRDLRATAARRAGDADVAAMVDDLLAVSAEFRELWERHEVGVRRIARKRFRHPEVGLVHLTCEVLLTPEADRTLLVYFPTEGTDAREKLDLLRVIGTQDLDPVPRR